ncbi:MAG: ABC transporter permease subunit [Candidatus Izemoplasmataceae bacterium]
MNIFLFELKQLRFSIIIWSLSLSVGLVFFMAFFPVFGSDAMAMEDLLAQYPEEFLAFFGMNSELPFTELMGYFALSYTFLMIPISVQTANYGFHILSVEERELTADFLLSKPISRATIYKAKLAAVVTTILITDIVLFGMSFASLYLFSDGATVNVTGTWVFLASMFLFQLFFLSVGMMISVYVKKVSSVLAYSMSLGFGLYIVSSLGMMISSDVLKILSPFSHFDPNYPFIHESMNFSRIWISIVVIVLSFIASYILYLRRNIKSL